MVCFHNRYSLGDKHDFKQHDYNSWEALQSAILRAYPNATILPLYLYDHSGITISTKPFGCPWDSGPIGFIYAERTTLREILGPRPRLALAGYAWDRNAEVILVDEVRLYDDYLRGNVYCFVLESKNGEMDSCGGFFGNDWRMNGLYDHLPEDVRDEILAGLCS